MFTTDTCPLTLAARKPFHRQLPGFLRMSMLELSSRMMSSVTNPSFNTPLDYSLSIGVTIV